MLKDLVVSIFLTLVILLICSNANATTYLYDQFDNNIIIDPIRWHWANGNKPIVADGKLFIASSNPKTNQEIYFTYFPNIIEAEMKIINANVTSNGYIGIELNCIWFEDYGEKTKNIDDKRVACRLGIVSSGAGYKLSAKIFSKGNNSIIYGRYDEPTGQLNQNYLLRIEKTDNTIYFFVNDQLYFNYNYEQDVQNNFSLIPEREYDHDYPRLVKLDTYNDINSSISGEIDNVKTDIDLDQNISNINQFSVTNNYIGFIDKEQRRSYLLNTTDAVLRSVLDRYTDCQKRYITIPSNGDVCSDYQAMNVNIQAFVDSISDLSTGYISGHEQCAQALSDTLFSWANANALIDHDYGDCNTSGGTNSDLYQLDWLTSTSALAYSLIKNASNISSSQLQIIENWISSLINKNFQYSLSDTDSRNNHLYYRGLASAITGVVTNNDEFFNFGMRTYYRAIDSLDTDGSFPLEMLRDKEAIHYQSFAIIPLIYIAEIAQNQGYDLYGVNIKNRNIHDAIEFLSNVIHNPDLLNLNQYHPSATDQTYFQKK